MNSGRLFRVLNTPNRVTAAVSMATFGVGLGIGYLLGKRSRLEVEFHEIPDKIEFDLTEADVNKARRESKKKRGTVVIPAMDRPEKVVVERIEDEPVKDYITIDGKITPVIEEKVREELSRPPVQEEPTIKSLFAKSGPDWNYDHEVKHRSAHVPYILHKDEFFENEKDYTQSTLTYYAGDGVLVDDKDVPIYNHEETTGPLKFGHGSGDPNVVYIRNDRYRAEYEILFDEGLYSVEIQGLQIENNERVKNLQHSKVRKFRPDT